MGQVRVASWNVREGVISEANPHPPGNSVMLEIVERILDNRIDVLALQEVTFTSVGLSSVLDYISATTKLKHLARFPFSPSSYFPGDQAGVAIASRFQIKDIVHSMLPNPRLEKNVGSGIFRSFDKGLLGCSIALDRTDLTLASLHLFPFRRFDRKGSEQELQYIWDSLSTTIDTLTRNRPFLLCGDFNAPDRSLILSRLRTPVKSAMDGRPTHYDLALDDILFTHEFQLVKVIIEDNFSDHSLCIAELEY